MADRDDPDRPIIVSELVDEPVGAQAQRAHPAQSAAQRIPGGGFAFEQTEGILDRVDERPIEIEQLEPGAARQDDSRQRSAFAATLGELAAKLVQRDAVPALELTRTRLYRARRTRVG